MTITKKIMGNTIGEFNILEGFIYRPILRYRGGPENPRTEAEPIENRDQGPENATVELASDSKTVLNYVLPTLASKKRSSQKERA
jgi:hypothetical protein